MGTGAWMPPTQEARWGFQLLNKEDQSAAGARRLLMSGGHHPTAWARLVHAAWAPDAGRRSSVQVF